MNNIEQTPLQKLKKLLVQKIPEVENLNYSVPALWVRAGNESVDGEPPIKVNPARYYLSHIEAVEENQFDSDIDPLKSLNSQLPGGDGGNWITRESIYNVFVRLTAAYDHNQDGEIGGSKEEITLNSQGVRETGTFLKCISMLGYIKSLGCSVIHLLPVTSIGQDGNKGELGSPYAIKNPYVLEPSLADTLIDMSVEEQFKAFVEAAHKLGIRVIAEFVFRTASKDSDWIAKNPDWFYWINKDIKDRKPGEGDEKNHQTHYGNPVFSQEELKEIHHKIENGDFSALPAPSENYRSFFKTPPGKESVRKNEKGQFRGKSVSPKSGKTTEVKIPGAFADWPPDDNQPPWNDVTYLRMYRDEKPKEPQFNYIAYNTIRMYDQNLARPELANESLWLTIEQLIPTYQRKYGIDGVMVDMGHAVPVPLMQRIINLARSIDPNFAFLSENFEITNESVEAGYNAVVGYAWWVEYEREGMYNLLEHIGERGVPLSFFGSVENHNTPRAASRYGWEKYSKYAFLVNTMLPRAIPFIHSGQELGEKLPVNTGLDFSDEQLKALKGKKLPLFDRGNYQWNGKHSMLPFIKKVLQIRNNFIDIVSNKDVKSFAKILTGHEDVICFLRQSKGRRIGILFNRNMEKSISGKLEVEWAVPEGVKKVRNLLEDFSRNKEFKVREGRILYNLEPGESCLITW
ncbi:MAG: alpha-amylase family glycosyl hydrolase [Candidatus Rifleibacteriota bacterium]